MKSHQPCNKAVPASIMPYCLLTGICCCYLTWLRNTLLLVTVFPVKPWTPEKISGMFIVSWPIRCENKPQKITDKPQQGSVTTWYETTSWPFLLRKIFNFPIVSLWKSYFLTPTNTGHLILSVQKPNYRIDLKVSANCENLQQYRFASRVKVSQLQKNNVDRKPLAAAN